MSCCGRREKAEPEHTQKWSFITLSDFRLASGWTTVSYIWMWYLGLQSIAVYAADTFTAINLLVFDKWSSQVKPEIPFQYSKWIFAICILVSWALCFYEWMVAIRVIRRDGVAESYMDPLAVSLQSMKSQGWRKFLVFAELTKSKKGVDYVALFVYFQFNGAIRIILAEGPRQVVNALTLFAVMKADLLTKGDHSAVKQFFLNIGALADKNRLQAVILFSMLFTLVIWVVFAVFLVVATVLYLVFLWHYIPQRDGRLSIYCRRKIDRRLEKIIGAKLKLMMEKEERNRLKVEQKQQKKGALPTQPKRQPTLPQIGTSPDNKIDDDRLPDLQLSRQDTSMTLPPYSSPPPTRNEIPQLQRQPTIPNMGDERPGMPSRHGTQGSAWSNASYRSDAPLLSNAGYAGEDPRDHFGGPTPPMLAFDRQASNSSFRRPLPERSMTQSSQGTRRFYPQTQRVESETTQRSFSPVPRMDSRGPERTFSPMSRNDSYQSSMQPVDPRMPVRSNTGFSFDTASPVSPADSYGRPMGPPTRQNTQATFRSALVRQDSLTSPFSRPTPGPYQQPPMHRRLYSQGSGGNSFSRPVPRSMQRVPTANSMDPSFLPAQSVGRQTPVPTGPDSYEMTSQPANLQRQPSETSNNGFVAFNPSIHSATPTPTMQQQRSLTATGQPGAAGNYFGYVQPGPQRSATAPITESHSQGSSRVTSGYGDILDNYGSDEDEELSRPPLPSGPLQRAHTAGPRYDGAF